MTEYLFVWDRLGNAWPARWVVNRGGPMPVPTDAAIDGVVTADESERLIDHLRTLYPEPRYVVARMVATNWQAVEDDFPGLHRH